jgi:hypothetical protein
MSLLLKLNSEPDGSGYFYGQAVAPDGAVHRVDILPPTTHWRGDHKPQAIDPLHWIIYIDGEEFARTGTADEIAAAVTAALPAST